MYDSQWLTSRWQRAMTEQWCHWGIASELLLYGRKNG
jgi:hypothetical protein